MDAKNVDGMTLDDLAALLREKGVTGAGGGGFPTYGKLASGIRTVIVNGAECEPLLYVDKYLMERFAGEIVTALDMVTRVVGAESGVIALKKTYTRAISALKDHVCRFPRLVIRLLDDVYPTGDEVVLTYDVTGQIVPQGCLPLSVGVTVFNVETMHNIYRAVFEDAPVTHKWLTVAGITGFSGMPGAAVTLRVPVGVPSRDVIVAAGASEMISRIRTADGGLQPGYQVAVRSDAGDYALIMGGPMTGWLINPDTPVTKTTKALLILPVSAKPVAVRLRDMKNDVRRAFSVCSQCRMCTDLCPRALLGHDTAPHKLMRMAISRSATPAKPHLHALYCSNCGLCEMYACHQGLSPRRLVMAENGALKASGARPEPGAGNAIPHRFRNDRRVPDSRLVSRLGLDVYARSPVIIREDTNFNEVMLPLCPPVGAQSIPVVKSGELVTEGQAVAYPDGDAFGVPVHASLSGTVSEVTEYYIRISTG